MMKKVIFLLTMILSLGAYAQPKIIMSNVPNGTFNSSNPFNFLDERGDFTGDGLPDMLIGQNSRAAVIFSGANGLSAIPRPIVSLDNLSGISVLKTLDTVSSLQIIYEDTLATLINDSVGLRFIAFKQSTGNKSVILRTNDVFNQYPGDETFVVDSSWKSIKVYHFDGLACDLLQTIQSNDTISALEFADFNHDNLDELLVICSAADSGFAKAKIYHQIDSTLAFWKELTLNKKQIQSAKIADMFLDGFPDIVISSLDSLSEGLSVINLLDTLLVPVFVNLNEKAYTEFVIGDFNSDNYPDLIALVNGVDSAAIYRNNQEGQMIYDSLFYTKCGLATPKNHSAAAFRCDNISGLDFIFCNGLDGLIRNQNLTPLASDLKISSVEWPASFQLGNNYQDTLKLKISNIGEAIASGDSLSARTTIYLKSLSDSLLAEKIINQVFDSLSVGDSITLDFVLDSINIFNCSKLEIVVEINPNQCLSELTLKNNSQKNEWEFSFPDLTIFEITFDTTGGTLSQDNVIVELRNIGCQAVDTAKIDFAASLKRGDSVYFSTEYRLSIPDLTADRVMNAYLYLGEISDSLNFLSSDSLIVSVFVDKDSVIFEADETNNGRILRLRIGDFLGLDPSPNSAEFNFQIYPNPTSGGINLTVPKTGTAEIFNNSGQIIWSQKVSGQTSIDLGNYPSGIYYLKINNLNLTKKIIKNK